VLGVLLAPTGPNSKSTGRSQPCEGLVQKKSTVAGLHIFPWLVQALIDAEVSPVFEMGGRLNRLTTLSVISGWQNPFTVQGRVGALCVSACVSVWDLVGVNCEVQV
jgi:hypothetical protein